MIEISAITLASIIIAITLGYLLLVEP